MIAAMQTADGSLSGPLALASLYVGIVLGDLGLYGLGWLAARFPPVARFIPPHRKEVVRAWLDGRVFKVVLISRFLPGLRLPTYTTCGFVGADLQQFALAVVIATICWTIAAVRRVAACRRGADGPLRRLALGRRSRVRVVRRARGQAHGVGPRRASGHETGDRTTRSALRHRATREQPLSFFEFWPDWLFYFPVVAHWIALGLRYGDFSLPTAANPTITAGGLCGESKLETLDQVNGPVRASGGALHQRRCAARQRARAPRQATDRRFYRLSCRRQAGYRLQRHRRATASRTRRPCRYLAEFPSRRAHRAAGIRRR